MRIAFISFEYPPDAAYGGIATYVHQAARMMSGRGHEVEVFTSSPVRSGRAREDGITVHRVQEDDYGRFPERISHVFARRHAEAAFDVLEGPEYAADAHEAVQLVPDIPLVVRLHTPTFLTVQGTYDGLPLMNAMRMKMLKHKVRRSISHIRHGRRPDWRFLLSYDVDRERRHALEADEIAAPSTSIAALLKDAWDLPEEKMSCFPYPYVPAPALLEIPVDTKTDTVTFVGRLEVRKGVMDFARAIPYVLDRHPHAHFRFVGSSEHGPDPDVAMIDFLQDMLEPHMNSVEFTGKVSPEQIPDVHAGTDICVFPSIWENFPNVCLEAMAAGRAIVGSRAGGMSDMLPTEDVGRLVDPGRPRAIAHAVNELLAAPEKRMAIGQAARRRLLDQYNTDRVGALHEACYRRAIERRRNAPVRRQNKHREITARPQTQTAG